MAQVDLEEDEDEQSSALDETDAVELQDDQVTEATELDSQDEDSLSAVEKTPPKKLQWFVGARYKMIILPKSLINVSLEVDFVVFFISIVLTSNY